jgi:T5SS/PEP-CTERM-associated repeat protein
LWRITSDIAVGDDKAAGVVNILGGGTVNSDNWGYIARGADSRGIVNIDGVGSMWQNNGPLYVGHDGSGELHISGGGTLNDTWSIIGYSPTSAGLVTVDGAGSAWNNNTRLDIGDNSGNNGKGTLSITGGGAVTAAQSLRINSRSMLAIDVGRGSALSVYSGNGAMFSNNGTVRILAGAGVAAGSYVPISLVTSGTWSGTGIYQAIGGTWNTTDHTFTASAVKAGASGAAVTINLADEQRTLINDSTTHWAAGASFLASATPSSFNFTATAVTGDALNLLKSKLGADEAVLSAWNFLADGYTVSETTPVYLSLKVGSGRSADDLDLWHYDGSAWTAYSPLDLTYDGAYASFTVTSFSGYAVSGLAVPEPSAIALLFAAAVGLAGYARSRRQSPRDGR